MPLSWVDWGFLNGGYWSLLDNWSIDDWLRCIFLAVSRPATTATTATTITKDRVPEEYKQFPQKHAQRYWFSFFDDVAILVSAYVLVAVPVVGTPPTPFHVAVVVIAVALLEFGGAHVRITFYSLEASEVAFEVGLGEIGCAAAIGESEKK